MAESETGFVRFPGSAWEPDNLEGKRAKKIQFLLPFPCLGKYGTLGKATPPFFRFSLFPTSAISLLDLLHE